MDDCIISNSITLISSTTIVPLFKQTWIFLGWKPRLNIFKQAMYLRFFLVQIVILIRYSSGVLGIQSAHY